MPRQCRKKAEQEADCSARAVQNARAIFVEIRDSYLSSEVWEEVCIVLTSNEAFRLGGELPNRVGVKS